MKPSFLFISSLILSSATLANGAKPTFLVKQPQKSVVDIPRGGGSPLPSGPFSADLAQKIFVGTYGINAAVCAISPSLGTSLYGIAGEPDVKRLMQSVGSVGVSHALLLYLQVFNGMSFEHAIGWSIWPFVITAFYQGAIAKNDHLLDFPTSNHIPSSVLNLIVFFASQTQASWTGSLNAFYGYFSLVNAIPMYFFPEAAAKAWQVTLKSNEAKLMFENLGYFLLAHGVTVVVGGSSGIADAIGWTALALSASLVGLVFRDEFKLVKQGPVYVWTLLLSFIANSLLSN